MAILSLVFWLAFFFMMKRYKKNSMLLKRKNEMGGLTQGEISGLEKIRRRNRSFRWTNEVPTVSYKVGDRVYKVELPEAEARVGTYAIGTPCTVHYITSEPDVCLVEEFEKKIKSSKTNRMIAAVLLGFFGCNTLMGIFTSLFNAVFKK